MNDKTKSKILFGVVICFIILLMTFFLIKLNSEINSEEGMICDYDSCSQIIDKFEYNGSRCWDPNNSDCREFLSIWRACQEHKRHMGVC